LKTVVKLAVTAPSYARRPRFLETLRVVRSVRRMYIKESGWLPSKSVFSCGNPTYVTRWII